MRTPSEAATSPPLRALLIAPAGSYRLSAWMRAAAGLGLDILVAGEGEYPLMAIELMPIEADGLGFPSKTGGLRIDFKDPQGAVDRILAEHRKQAIAAVIGTDDISLELAGLTAKALGLAHNDPESARISRRKDLARRAMAAAGLPIPSFRRLDLRLDLARQIDALWERRSEDCAALPFAFPCVVKPLAMSAGRGVIRADDRRQLLDACRRTAAIVDAAKPSIDDEEARWLLIESFVPGPEIALEGLLRQGELRTIAIFDKPDPLDGPFFEETLYITPSRLSPRLQRLARQRVQEGCAACGLREGPVHAELRIHDRDAWIIEIAARTIGGDCSRLFRLGAEGKSLETMILQHALLRSPDFSCFEERAAGVSMIPTPEAGVLRRVEGVLEASRIAGIQEVSIAVREGYPLLPLPEGGDYLGFVFAQGKDPEEVEGALRRANDELRVIVAPSIALDIAG
ncbi:MAG: ATP-grasp domain-containing protein [Ectothiorhodospiraceae bacterium AqS1]|nr:ATP-grasp domain-containing protein [Ectothiorhodospiraceae bacterium AqS1]